MKIEVTVRPRTLVIISCLLMIITVLAFNIGYFVIFESGKGSFWDNVSRAICKAMMSSMLQCIVGVFIGTGLTICLNRFHSFSQRLSLWRLYDPKKCFIAISSMKTHAFHWWSLFSQTRYAVGEGQMVALPHIIASLQDAYGDQISWDNFTHANDPKAFSYMKGGEGDIILVGGPLTNPLTQVVFDMLRDRINIIKLDNSGIAIGKAGREGVYDEFKVSDNFKVNEKGARIDKALILCYDDDSMHTKRRIIVLAGCTTYGTGIVAKYFCTQLIHCNEWKKNKNKNFAAIVECGFSQHPPVYTHARLAHFITFE